MFSMLPCRCSAPVMKFSFTKIASVQPATLLKIPPNEIFKDIENNNGTPCFIE